MSHSAKTFGGTITLPFNVNNNAFAVITCFSSSFHRYLELVLKGPCSCRLHDTLRTRLHLSFYYSTFVAFVFYRLQILQEALLKLFVYILLTYIDDRSGFIQWEGHFGPLQENIALSVWQNTIGCWHCSILSGSTLVGFWPEIFASYSSLRYCFLTLLSPIVLF